jgi:hypothetical protein
MREILAAFINRAEGALRLPPGGEPIPVRIDERVQPPGAFTSADKDQLARLTRSGCLAAEAMSHGALEVDRAAFLAAHAALAAEEASEGSPASQHGGGAGAGTQAEPRSEQSGARADALAGGNAGARAGQRTKPDAGGRGARRGGAGGKSKP